VITHICETVIASVFFAKQSRALAGTASAQKALLAVILDLWIITRQRRANLNLSLNLNLTV